MADRIDSYGTIVMCIIHIFFVLLGAFSTSDCFRDDFLFNH